MFFKTFLQSRMAGALLILLLLQGAATEPAAAALDPKQAEGLIQYFHIDTQALVDPSSNLEADLTRPDSRINQVVSTLDRLMNLTFKPYPEGFIQVPYSDYVSMHSTAITTDSQNHCGKGLVVACHFIRQLSPMWLTERFFDDTLETDLGRAAILIHESRHGEGYDHVECTRGPSFESGDPSPVCDSTFQYGGAYASEVEFKARVALYGENIHPSEASYMRRSALLTLKSFVNEDLTYSGSSLLVLKKQSGELVTFDGQNASVVPDVKLDGETLMGFPGLGKVLLANPKTETARMIDAENGVSRDSILDAIGASDAMSRIGVTQSFIFHTQVRDLYYDGFYYVVLRPFAVSPTIYDSSGKVPSQIISCAGCQLAYGKSIVAITDSLPSGRSGIFFVVQDPARKSLLVKKLAIGQDASGRYVAQAQDTDEVWPAGAISLQSLNGKIYGLFDGGEVREVQSDGSSLAVPALAGSAFEQVKSVSFKSEMRTVVDTARDVMRNGGTHP